MHRRSHIGNLTDRSQAGRIHSLEALVLPRITSDIPATPVGSQCDWKHLQRISLVDTDYGTPKAMDLLLGADIFSSVVLHRSGSGHLDRHQCSRRSLDGS